MLHIIKAVPFRYYTPKYFWCWLLYQFASEQGRQLLCRVCVPCQFKCFTIKDLFSFNAFLYIAFSGVISLTTSSQSQILTDSLLLANIPLISPTSSAPSLSNTTKYPNFFRTISSSVGEVKVCFHLTFLLIFKYLRMLTNWQQLCYLLS